ncbi:prepilin-type N-terminal cleavage/methylation domain-containing protein [Cupriavidus necator]|uniref:Type II secretion system protein H n=1 Tax=Cupriavidus necator TaxID=106590 RepID=A0A1U9UJY8_CUPNE|nr:GspH/FimT family pseudopilin [Cupriavidus necator]AQV92777.1 prepilin-type N-terminal cleavage/methylation domain-containing protein [Cupriavidus necator]
MTPVARPIAARTSSSRIPSVAGFTLIELITTVMIAAILLTVATPYFRDFVLGQRIRTAAYDLASTLVYARSEAIKRNTGVAVAPATGGWQNGWSVTVGTTVLSRHEAMSGLTVTGQAGNLVYNSNGRLAATASPFSISATSSTAKPQCVNVDLGGLPSSFAGSC